MEAVHNFLNGTREEWVSLTVDASAVAEINRVPDHGPVGNG